MFTLPATGGQAFACLSKWASFWLHFQPQITYIAKKTWKLWYDLIWYEMLWYGMITIWYDKINTSKGKSKTVDGYVRYFIKVSYMHELQFAFPESPKKYRKNIFYI